jgi:hypothetical protein
VGGAEAAEVGAAEAGEAGLGECWVVTIRAWHSPWASGWDLQDRLLTKPVVITRMYRSDHAQFGDHATESVWSHPMAGALCRRRVLVASSIRALASGDHRPVGQCMISAALCMISAGFCMITKLLIAGTDQRGSAAVKPTSLTATSGYVVEP